MHVSRAGAVVNRAPPLAPSWLGRTRRRSPHGCLSIALHFNRDLRSGSHRQVRPDATACSRESRPIRQACKVRVVLKAADARAGSVESPCLGGCECRTAPLQAMRLEPTTQSLAKVFQAVAERAWRRVFR